MDQQRPFRVGGFLRREHYATEPSRERHIQPLIEAAIVPVSVVVEAVLTSLPSAPIDAFFPGTPETRWIRKAGPAALLGIVGYRLGLRRTALAAGLFAGWAFVARGQQPRSTDIGGFAANHLSRSW